MVYRYTGICEDMPKRLLFLYCVSIHTLFMAYSSLFSGLHLVVYIVRHRRIASRADLNYPLAGLPRMGGSGAWI